VEPKQLKASYQLAKMRYDSDPSEVNTSRYELAKAAYEACQKPEVEKIEQVSGEIENTDLPEDTNKTGDSTGASEPAAPAEKTIEPVAEQKTVDPIAGNVEPISEPETEEKKTEVDDQPLS
jgi:hypothetical protein